LHAVLRVHAAGTRATPARRSGPARDGAVLGARCPHVLEAGADQRSVVVLGQDVDVRLGPGQVAPGRLGVAQPAVAVGEVER
jgi:hypothetical protein